MIGRCWADHPGEVLDVDGEEPHLRALATYYAAQGGQLWVTTGVQGMIATVPRALELWTDTRFHRAHRFYDKRGYLRREKRALEDRSESKEWHYVRELAEWKVARRIRARRTGLNLDNKRAFTIGTVHTFILQYGRKAQRGTEPNDRRFSADADRLVSRLRPEALDRLLRDDEPDG